MNENSPIWASATATVTDALNGYPNAQTSTSATNGLPTSTMASAPSTSRGDCNKAAGASSMPTDTKNSTANASRIGSASDAARRLYSDRPTTMPARNAPRAIETLKTSADPTAMPSASTSTVSVNSSRERVAAT